MSTITFDTHKFVKKLEASGVPSAQAEVMIEVFRESQDSAELATKTDLKLAIADLRADLIKWMVGLALAQFGVLIGILLKLPH